MSIQPVASRAQPIPSASSKSESGEISKVSNTGNSASALAEIDKKDPEAARVGRNEKMDAIDTSFLPGLTGQQSPKINTTR